IPNIFRPFRTAEELEQAVIEKRPNWAQNANLKKLVDHLRNNNTLTARSHATSQWYKISLDKLEGALDFLPDFGDNKLVADLLTTTTFRSSEGMVWKANDTLETYAPTTEFTFSIVPYKSEIGLIPVNEVSCNRCHQDAGRQIGEYSNFTQL